MSNKLTAAQVADRLHVGRSTVNLWCRQGRFPDARMENSPVGSYWLIPESDLKRFKLPTLGRPPRPASTLKRATGQKNASNGPSSKKKGGKK
jgi:excisionase family DNA binding protein